MDVEALSASPIGVLVPIAGFDGRHGTEFAHSAFIPHPLPERIELTTATWMAINAATKSLGMLDQVGARLPDPARFREPFLRREAISTSALEGTHAAFTDVLEAEALDEPGTPEIREILNYVEAARYAILEVQDGRAITWDLLCAVHRLLVAGTRADGPDAGRQRTNQVLIGPEHCTVDEARFVPAPPDDRLTSGVDALLSWITAEHRDLPAVAQVAIAHYQFETLHPFNDGNGRIGRLLILLHLMQLREVTQPLLEVSGWLERRRRTYQDGLLDISTTGSFDEWVRFMATAIDVQATQTRERVDALLGQHDQMRQHLTAERMSPTGMRLFEDLLATPYVTVAAEARRLEVSFQAANQAVKRLVSLGVLQQVTERGNYDRLFVAPALLELITP
ncbi:MAG TPA: Fic/DOC family N-terminal domain-containing protein [Microthrixaceae bacterium]|nr:Fic/DOC family N-terminal domain-containing protein [Microthrixaceae bacterium]